MLITLHGVRSKSLKKADKVFPLEAEIQANIQIQAEMAEVEVILSVVTQVAIQAAAVMVMAMRGRCMAHIRCKYSQPERSAQTKKWKPSSETAVT